MNPPPKPVIDDHLRVQIRVIFIYSIVGSASLLLLWSGFDLQFVSDQFWERQERSPTNITSLSEAHEALFFTNETREFLTFMYKSAEQEIAVCLYGRIENQSIYIDRVRETTLIEREVHRVRYEPCARSQEFLGTLHTHPAGICQLTTPEDWFAFGSDRSLIGGIMCGEERFIIYHRTDLRKPLLVSQGGTT